MISFLDNQGKEVSRKDTRNLMHSKHRKLETDLAPKEVKKRVGKAAFKNQEGALNKF